MSETNLFEFLRVPEVEQGELEQILFEHFHQAMAVGPEEIVYPSHETDYAVKVRYADGILSQILSGPPN